MDDSKKLEYRNNRLRLLIQHENKIFDKTKTIVDNSFGLLKGDKNVSNSR